MGGLAESLWRWGKERAGSNIYVNPPFQGHNSVNYTIINSFLYLFDLVSIQGKYKCYFVDKQNLGKEGLSWTQNGDNRSLEIAYKSTKTLTQSHLIISQGKIRTEGGYGDITCIAF